MLLELHYQDSVLNKEYNEMTVSVVDAISGLMKSYASQCSSKIVNVVITSPDYIRSLNDEFRNLDKATDVLSFPFSAPGEADSFLGEVYICWERVLLQAEEYDHSVPREFAYLVVHGLLHLLGYEHGLEPDPEMRAREEEILAALNLGRL